MVTLLLILANAVFSYIGFTRPSFFERYKFHIERVRVNKEYVRLISSGFLHVSWTHLIFNMLTLYLFGMSLEADIGSIPFLIVYMVSLLGGDVLSLFIHRYHSDYSAVGASGAVCGIIFASIALYPGMSVLFFFFPMPGWLYGLLYVGYSIYGIRSAKDNIGHDAHLGGALAGMITALLFQPSALIENYGTILLITIPAIVFIYLIVSRPHLLLVDNLFFKNNDQHYSIDHKYNRQRTLQQKEVDRILDKINKKGMDSLSPSEKALLREYSKKIR